MKSIYFHMFHNLLKYKSRDPYRLEESEAGQLSEENSIAATGGAAAMGAIHGMKRYIYDKR